MAKNQKIAAQDRVEKIVIRYGNDNFKVAGQICQKFRRIANRTNYIARNVKIEDKQPSHSAIDKLIKKGTLSEDDKALYQRLPAAVSQRATQIVGKEWKSYFQALKEWKKSPGKFLGKPKAPGYANKAKTAYIPRSSFYVSDGYLNFAKALGLSPVPVPRLCDNQPYNAKAGENTISEVRIVPTGNCYVMEIIYNRLLSKHYAAQSDIILDKSKHLFIDIGLNNLACLVSDQPDYQPVLINGRPIKSINAKYNKLTAQLRSLNKKGHLGAKGIKRHHQIYDYLHKASKYIVDECIHNDLGSIVIGHNSTWKQGINIGKRNNQKFVFVPHAIFIEMIIYKAQSYGIKVKVREESYTSKASAIDLDDVPTYEKGSKIKHIFSGKRVKRGLYRSQSGKLLNADVNGALNIGRKEIGNDFVKSLLDSGCVYQPVLVMVDKSIHNRNKPKKMDIDHHSKLTLAA